MSSKSAAIVSIIFLLMKNPDIIYRPENLSSNLLKDIMNQSLQIEYVSTVSQ